MIEHVGPGVMLGVNAQFAIMIMGGANTTTVEPSNDGWILRDAPTQLLGGDPALIRSYLSASARGQRTSLWLHNYAHLAPGVLYRASGEHAYVFHAGTYVYECKIVRLDSDWKLAIQKRTSQVAKMAVAIPFDAQHRNLDILLAESDSRLLRAKELITPQT